MESREMSQSNNELEKDVTLNSESVQQDQVTELSEQKPEVAAAVTEEVVNQVSETQKVSEESLTNYAAMDKKQLVEVLQNLAQQPVNEVKEDVVRVRVAFAAIRKEELAKEKEAFIAKGNEEAAFAPAADELEEQFKSLYAEIKEKRAAYNAAQDALKAENLAKKREIISKINEIAEDADNVNRQYSTVQQLQQDFKAIGEVPSENDTEVWKSYQVAVERFYDLLKMNKELRDYDFKKNLEQKQALCAEAEALDEEADIVDAFKKLQQLHTSWREIGPVSKEIREELWTRFKNASAVINKKYQSFFEERKANEKKNAEGKEALCVKIEAISTDNLKTYAAWDEATKAIIGLQEEWKKLGFASRKVNTELFARFRKSCDEFFAKKAEFFKRMKDELAANLAKKIELCEKAEALKDSTEWKKTTDALIALQKEWKTVGPVVKKHSDAVWKRFIAACDAFFEEKKKQNVNVHSVEHENLKQKKDIIAQINSILENKETEDAPNKVRELMKKWQEVGHVPYKEKDKVYAEYKAAIDKAFEQLDMKAKKARMANFANSINQMSDTGKVYHERERLVRAYEMKSQELKTYENNLGFFNAQSKSGNSLVKEMERKIANIKEEIAMLEQKIKLIDEKI
ncbi:MAG: DUF349 domain-containing protein [Sodaliphilus sp.]|nr:DUF349 domain-containing protein [Bacteroidales bacterium]MDY2591743.1 DUF349 domain-containing protein [Sodaliphilus sp.]MCI6293156.1 DUF349 domain-containing protein [Bacteroidales bacterium]MCI6335977.1 DUF349 domain-containing protein [Bacteroidales bacterium]MCI6903255.1 DUF349 domain-containing protein [Bacteroidales bacterium]